jgi:hypothetical protein
MHREVEVAEVTKAFSKGAAHEGEEHIEAVTQRTELFAVCEPHVDQVGPRRAPARLEGAIVPARGPADSRFELQLFKQYAKRRLPINEHTDDRIGESCQAETLDGVGGWRRQRVVVRIDFRTRRHKATFDVLKQRPKRGARPL